MLLLKKMLINSLEQQCRKFWSKYHFKNVWKCITRIIFRYRQIGCGTSCSKGGETASLGWIYLKILPFWEHNFLDHTTCVTQFKLVCLLLWQDCTCMALNPPGFQLYDGVGKHTIVLPLAAVSDGLSAQIQVAHNAERTDFVVVNVVGPHHKGQAPGGRQRGDVGGCVNLERKKPWGFGIGADSLISIKVVTSIQVGADGLTDTGALTDDSRFTVVAFLRRHNNKK